MISPASKATCWSWTLFSLALLAGQPAWGEEEEEKSGQWYMFSPWRVQGDIGYAFSWDWEGGEGSSSQMDHDMVVNLSIGRESRGYLWKPWLARWSTSLLLGGSWSRQITSLSQTMDEEANDVTTSEPQGAELNRNVDGEMRLQLFPESRFPGELFYTRRINDSSQNIEGSRGSFVERIGMLQSYRNVGGTLTANLRLERDSDYADYIGHSDIKRFFAPGYGDYASALKNNIMTFDAFKRFEDQSISFNSQVERRTDRDDNDDMRENLTSVMVRHNYFGSAQWSMENMASYIKLYDYAKNIELDETTGATSTNIDELETTTQQWTTSAGWRALEEPITLSGTLRLQNEDEIDYQDGTNDAAHHIIRSADLTTGAQWLFSRELHLNFSLGMRHQAETLGSQRASLDGINQSLFLNYMPPPEDFSWFQYGWNTAGGVNNQWETTTTEGNRATNEFQLAAGHNINKNMPLNQALGLSFMLNEGGSVSTDNENGSEAGATHSLSANLHHTVEDVRTYLSLNLTDSRDLVGGTSENQLVNLQASREQGSEEDFVWRGDITVQWSRTIEDEEDKREEDDTLLGDDEEDEDKSPIDMSINGVFNVRKNNLLRIRGLNFWTDITARTLGLVGRDKNKENVYAVDSHLEYRIGKLIVALSANYVEMHEENEDTRRRSTIMCEFKRRFDHTVPYFGF